MIDLNELGKKCEEINDKRMKNGATVDKDLLKHCAGELVEAIISRGKYCNSVVNPELSKKFFADELADVIVCVLIESAKHDIDIEGALMKCVEKNMKRSIGKGDKL